MALIRCEGSCGRKHRKKDIIVIVAEGIRHNICRECVSNSECIEIMRTPFDEEINLVGSLYLQDGVVKADIPDFGFARDYVEGENE